jgi:glucose-1-phosphate adenylyltransferase
MRLGTMWYRGTADAVRQNLNLISDFDPDVIAVFGADHIYRMDIGQMLQFHTAAQADITLATIPIPLKTASSFGIVETSTGGLITSFEEKPQSPRSMLTDPSRALSSMGNYLFNTDVLLKVLKEQAQDPNLDFGRSILPIVHKRFKAYAYDFSTNVLPGSKPYEEKAYWRDVGTLAAYYQSNMDILGARPRLNLNNRRWSIHSGRYDGPPAKVLAGALSNCIIGDGCFIRNATIKNSILGRGVHVHDGAVIEDSIVMDFCKVRSEVRIRRAIVDRFNEIAAKDTIGHSHARDAESRFVDSSGIVAVPRGQTLPQ